MCKRLANSILPLGSVALLIIGCGGLKDVVGPSDPDITLTASSTEIEYGDAITLSWSSNKLDFVESSNFGVAREIVNGSITDRPATDTTYRITAGANGDPDRHSAQAGVRVRSTNKSYLVVGDSSVAGVTQVSQYVASITSRPVPVSLTFPPAPAADAVVILGSASVGFADHANVQTFLASGGAILLVGDAPRKLATGSTSTDDISAIGSWFAGATRCANMYFGHRLGNESLPGFPLSVTLRGASVDSNALLDVRPISSEALNLAPAGDGGAAFAYKPAIGGRVFYVGAYGAGSSEVDLNQKALFLAGCRWATSNL